MRRISSWLITGILILGILTVWVHQVSAQMPTSGSVVPIYLFIGEGCPHCAKAKPYFESLAETYPEINLQVLEVYYNGENQAFFLSMAERAGIQQFAVPTIFIGPYYLQGYSEELNPEIEAVVIKCMKDGCADPALGLVSPSPTSAPTPISEATQAATSTPEQTPVATPVLTVTPLADATATPIPSATATAIPAGPVITPTQGSLSLNNSSELVIPLLGKVDLTSKSSIVSTALIALVDGFNPCSLWVLTMLLALTLHTGSRKKVFLIGIVFLTVSSAIYALFIVGLFSVLKFASFMGWIRAVVALVALFFALVNIKDYFWYKEGLSLTISNEKKPGIFKKMRAVMNASQSLGGLIVATVTLAAGVSMVEFACTAGFPVVWTNILTSQNITGSTFILLLILYMLIYQFDEMVIFFSSVATLKASRVEEKHGRVLKLISGVLMLTLSMVMLQNPELLNNLNSSLLIFGSAFIVTFLIVVIHRHLLPRIGVFIGSDHAKK